MNETCHNPKCSRHAPKKREVDWAFWVVFGGALALNALVCWATRA